MNRLWTTILLLTWGLLLSPTALRAEDARAGLDGDWTFRGSAYGWLLSIDGDASVGDVTADLELDFFNDILEILEAAAMGNLEVRKGRWFLHGDLFWAATEDSSTLDAETLSFGPKTLSDGTLTLEVPETEVVFGPGEFAFDFDVVIAKFVGGYRFLSMPLGTDENPRELSIDAYVGGRYWFMKPRIRIEVPPTEIPGFDITPFLDTRFGTIQFDDISVSGITLGGSNGRIKGRSHHVDPIVGLRVEHDLSRTWSISVSGDVGGFGIGSAADFSWGADALVFCHFGERWSLVAGYRAIGLDRDSGEIPVDIRVHGPLIGASYRWGGSKP